MEEREGQGERRNGSIYRALRTIKRRDNTLYNALCSIHQDSIFVGEISQLWPQLPLLANLRCGLWYSRGFHGSCYFKSTDVHAGNWGFSTSRLNLHVATLAGQKGGCIIVDSTRKGKRFPDSMSKTIPIWACVLNRAVHNYIKKVRENGVVTNGSVPTSKMACNWDCSLHLPLWISQTERASIEDRLGGWTEQLEGSGADIASVALLLKKPLRPLWISQRTVIWLNEIPDHDSWDFTPIILVNASASTGTIQQRTTSEFSWNYIPGAGDDEESWARGLTPNLFWTHAVDVMNSGPGVCNQKVADIVEKDRVYRAHRGENAPQLSNRPSKFLGLTNRLYVETDTKLLYEEHTVSWLGSTNIAVGRIQTGICLLNYFGYGHSFLPVSPSVRGFLFYVFINVESSKNPSVSILFKKI